MVRKTRPPHQSKYRAQVCIAPMPLTDRVSRHTRLFSSSSLKEILWKISRYLIPPPATIISRSFSSSINFINLYLRDSRHASAQVKLFARASCGIRMSTSFLRNSFTAALSTKRLCVTLSAAATKCFTIAPISSRSQKPNYSVTT